MDKLAENQILFALRYPSEKGDEGGGTARPFLAPLPDVGGGVVVEARGGDFGDCERVELEDGVEWPGLGSDDSSQLGFTSLL